MRLFRSGLLTAAIALAASVGVVAPPTAGASIASNVAAQLSGLKLVSYYPSTAAWTGLWENWNPSQVQKDFVTIRALGANAVRLIVGPTSSGWPTPTATMSAELASAVAMANATGLKTQLSLFDLWGGYTDLQRSDTWARALLSPYKDDPRIAFVEVKNEIDPTSGAAMAWARHEIPVVKSAVGTTPVTISTAGVRGLTGLLQLKAALATTPIDFFDYHYYDSADKSYAVLASVKAAVQPSPLFIGEAGYSTYAPTTAGQAARSASQSDFFARLEWATTKLGLPAAAPWILRDIVPNVASARTATNGSSPAAYEYYFGLYSSSGVAKPAASTLRQFFTTGLVDASINGDFERGSGTMPTGWHTVGSGTFVWNNRVGYSGSHSLMASGTANNRNEYPGFWCAPVIQPTHDGQVFQLTGRIVGIHATGASDIAMAFFGSTGNYLGMAHSAVLGPRQLGWVPLSVTAASPRGATSVQLFLQSNGNTGSVWFDSVEFSALD